MMAPDPAISAPSASSLEPTAVVVMTASRGRSVMAQDPARHALRASRASLTRAAAKIVPLARWAMGSVLVVLVWPDRLQRVTGAVAISAQQARSVMERVLATLAMQVMNPRMTRAAVTSARLVKSATVSHAALSVRRAMPPTWNPEHVCHVGKIKLVTVPLARLAGLARSLLATGVAARTASLGS